MHIANRTFTLTKTGRYCQEKYKNTPTIDCRRHHRRLKSTYMKGGFKKGIQTVVRCGSFRGVAQHVRCKLANSVYSPGKR